MAANANCTSATFYQQLIVDGSEIAITTWDGAKTL